MLLYRKQYDEKSGTVISQANSDKRHYRCFWQRKSCYYLSPGKQRIKVYHRYYLYDDKDYILTEFSVESTQDISSNYLAPVKTSTTTNFLPHLNNKTLFVPFDNDRWVRYKAVNFGTSSTSYEVGLVFNATSKQGLVLGSIEHDTWKTGIVISTNAFNDVKSMEVYGGITSEETRDVLSHGKVKGKN